MWPKPTYFQNAGEGGEGGGGAGDGGSGDEPWYSGLVEDSPELPAMLRESPDFDTFVKQAVDYQAMQGSSIRIPGENASDEDRAAFYARLVERVPGLIPEPNPEDAEAMKAFHARLGVPEDGAGYELKLAEGQQADEALQNWFRETAHNLKLPKAQAEQLFTRYNEMQAAQNGAAVEQLKEQDKALRAEWGATYEPQMQKIQTLWANYPEFRELAENAKQGLVPAHVYKGFAKIAEGMMGKGFEMLGQPPGGDAPMTPAEAKLQVDETIKKLAKLEPSDPARAGLMTELIRLQKLAMPDADHSAPARAGFSS